MGSAGGSATLSNMSGLTTKCPKCDGVEILRVPGTGHGWAVANVIPVALMSVVSVTRYVCESCGFTEEWVDSKEDLHRLRQAYGRSVEWLRKARGAANRQRLPAAPPLPSGSPPAPAPPARHAITDPRG